MATPVNFTAKSSLNVNGGGNIAIGPNASSSFFVGGGSYAILQFFITGTTASVNLGAGAFNIVNNLFAPIYVPESVTVTINNGSGATLIGSVVLFSNT